MLQSIERASVAVSIVDAEGRQQLEHLFLDGNIGRVEGRRQLGHVLAVLDDVVQSDSGIHDGSYGIDALYLQPSSVDLVPRFAVDLLSQAVPTFTNKPL